MKFLSWLTVPVVLAPSSVTTTPSLLSRIPELKPIGLNDAQLESIIEPRATNATCVVNGTDGVVFPCPTSPPIEDFLKRNFFVTRYAFFTFVVFALLYFALGRRRS